MMTGVNDMILRCLYYKLRLIGYRILLQISHTLYIKFRYYELFKQPINLDNPKTFSEKIQWLKLYDRDERIVLCADKFLVRKHISSIVGDEFLIPMPFVWNKPEDINFALLPDKFVLKPNNSSGRVLICKEKNKLNKKKTLKIIKKWQRENLTRMTGEWVYEKIPFRIVCEEYLADNIMDYKMYFSNGEFICTQVIAGRAVNKKQFGYFDENWNLLNIKRCGISKLQDELQKPEKYQEMIEIATKLSQGFTFVRVDLYYIDDKIYFGELSFYPNNGFVKYETSEMDEFFSDKIILPLS